MEKIQLKSSDFPKNIQERLFFLRNKFKKNWKCVGITYSPKSSNYLDAIILLLSKNIRVFLLSDKLSQGKIESLKKNYSIDGIIGPAGPYAWQLPTDPDVSEKLLQNYCELSGELVFLTSGSTGEQKIVLHQLEGLLTQSRAVCDFFKLNTCDSWAITLPLNHVGGLQIVFRAFIGKLNFIFFKPNLEEEILKNANVNIISLVPTQLIRLIKNKETLNALKNYKLILLGGAPVPKWLIDFCIFEKLNISKSYGMTETGALVTATGIGKTAELESSGKAIGNVQIEVDKNNNILVKTPAIFKQYLNEKNHPLNNFDPQGFYKTKDIGRIKNHLLYIDGRCDLIFISGGENIDPFEIEKEILQIKNIYEVLVTSIPHPEWGATAVAFILMDTFDEVAIYNCLKKCLEPHKIPKHFINLEQMSKDGIKYSRKELTLWALENIKV